MFCALNCGQVWVARFFHQCFSASRHAEQYGSDQFVFPPSQCGSHWYFTMQITTPTNIADQTNIVDHFSTIFLGNIADLYTGNLEQHTMQISWECRSVLGVKFTNQMFWVLHSPPSSTRKGRFCHNFFWGKSIEIWKKNIYFSVDFRNSGFFVFFC